MSFGAGVWIAIPAISSLLFGLLFYSRGPRERQGATWFSAFLLTGALWSSTSMLLHAAPSYLDLNFLARLLMFANFAVPLAILGFTRQFLSLERLQLWMELGIAGYVLVAILNVAGLVVAKIEVANGLVGLQFGPGIYVAGVYVAFCTGSSAYFLVRELRATPDPTFRRRLRYILAVLVLVLTGDALNATWLRAYPVDLFSAALAAVLISLSISRYEILEVRHTLRRLVVLALLLTVFVLVISGVIVGLGSLNRSLLFPLSIAGAGLAAVVAYQYPPIRRSIDRAVERLFRFQLYDMQSLMYVVSRTSNCLTLPGQLGLDLLQDFQRALQFESGALLLGHDPADEFTTVATLSLPAAAEHTRFRADSPLINELTDQRAAVYVDHLLELPRLRALWTEEWQALASLQAQVLLPVRSQVELIGFFVLGPRRRAGPYTRDELQRTLPTLANQVAVALANSRLYAQEQARADTLARANEELRQLARMKDHLVQNVSHELRTPLSIIQGYAELLVEGGFSTPEEQGEAVAIVLRQARHLNHLVNQLLTFQHLARAEVAMQPILVSSWLAGVTAGWHTLLAQGDLQLCLDIAEDVGQVNGNHDYLRQVVDNLLDNARKFSKPGGQVTVSVRRQHGTVRVAITDQGIGASAEQLGKMFERFYQADGSTTRRFSGMGIGLALCREIVERHGGRIWAESPGLGLGLTVNIELPGA